MKKIQIIALLIVFALYSCKNTSTDSPIDLFSHTINLSETKYNIDEDSLALIEGIQCNDNSLIVTDFHLGKSFSIFNLQTGKYIGRFGKIGQGPDELPLGCTGNLEYNKFSISFDFTGLIASYNMDSLLSNINSKPKKLARKNIPETSFSRVIPLNDSVFLGAGVYKSEYQYALFDKQNKVIDYNIDIFNAKDEKFNMYHKFISNQGTFKKHPMLNQFVYSLNNSSNIDFIDVSNNKINLIKSIRLKNPICNPIQFGDLSRVVPDNNSIIGYIDIATSNKYVYTLYADKLFVNENGTGNKFNSDIVLVFDWKGNPVKKYKLTKEAFYIAINEKSKKLYAAIKKTDGSWSIATYDISEK
jgi:hypothetical protein